MVNLFITTITAIFVTAIVSLFALLIEPTGYNVSCNNAEFSMPAGTKANAEIAAKTYTGCTITKMEFKS